MNFALDAALHSAQRRAAGAVHGFPQALGDRLALLSEFAVLLAALLLVANGWVGLAWAYLAYSVLNAIAAWLILRQRR